MVFRFALFSHLAVAALLPTGVLPAQQAPAGQPAATASPTTAQVVARLTAAIENLKSMRAVVEARERIGDKYISATSAIKLTTKPLRIYLKNQKGVEVLYVTGHNGGDAWVYPAAFPYVTLSLDPQGALMRRDQHHTALQIGFGTIADLLASSDKVLDKSFTRSFRYVGDSTAQQRRCYVLRADYPQFRYVSYKVGKNETPATVAAHFGCGEYRVLERNNLSVGSHLAEGQVLQVPNAYGRRVVVLVDPRTFLPMSVTVHDDRGLFERFEFSNVVANQPIPPEEFTKDYKGYKL